MNNKIYDVVALGELLVDFTNNGMSQQGNPLFEANPGGAPCNVLSMLQNLGHKTAFIGKVGNDYFGKLLYNSISQQGISTEGLVYDQSINTTLAFVHTLDDGDRDFSFYRNPGADMMLNTNEVPEDLISSGKIFHFGTLSMTDSPVKEATESAVEIAQKNKLLISFDPNLRVPLWKNLEDAKQKMAYGMNTCDILKISDDEIIFFTGQEDLDKGIRQIRDQFDIKLICATFGKNGSIIYYGDEKVKCNSFIQPKTVDTTGAGDTFMGCILHKILENGINNLNRNQLFDMLAFANAAASIITTKKGALKVMPKHNEICELLKRNSL